MFEVVLENGETLWINVFQVKSMGVGDIPDTTEISMVDGDVVVVKGDLGTAARAVTNRMRYIHQPGGGAAQSSAR